MHHLPHSQRPISHKKIQLGPCVEVTGTPYHTLTPTSTTRMKHTRGLLTQRAPPTLQYPRNLNTEVAALIRRITAQTMPTKAYTHEARTHKVLHVTIQPSVNPHCKHRKTPNQPSTQKPSHRGLRPTGLIPPLSLPHAHTHRKQRN